MATYKISTGPDGQYIECLVCHMKSYHPGDIEHLYCGFCHQFHVRNEVAHLSGTLDRLLNSED